MAGQKALNPPATAIGKKTAVARISKAVNPAEAQLTTELLVQSALASANKDLVSMVLVRRGDARHGAVLVRLDHPDGTAVIESRSLDVDGVYRWSVLAGEPPLSFEDAESRLAQEVKFDPDCWIVAIDSVVGDNPLRNLET